jgi:hypothetical protein
MGFAEGFQSGFSTVTAAMKARRENALRRQIGQEAARYGVTEGAYGQGLGENVQQVQGLQQQALDQARYQGASEEDLARIESQYAPSIAELQRRQGLTAPDFTIASRSMRPEDTFATREAAELAARPMRTQGLARVYRDAGEVEKADEAEARAMQMEAAGLTLRSQRRTEATAAKVEAVDASLNQWLTARLTDADGNMRAPTMDDNIAALQYRATELGKAGLAAQAVDVLKDYQGFAANQITLDTARRNSELGGVAAAVAQGDLTPAVAFYDRYVLDGAKVTGMKTDPKTGAITVSRVRDDGTAIPDKVIKGGANELLAALNSFKDPMSLYNFSQNEFANNLKVQELGLAKRKLDIAERDTVGEGGMTKRQKTAFDVLKGTDAFKTAVERGDQPKIRDLLVKNGLPPELFLGGAATPPGGGTMDEPTEPAPAKPDSANRTPTRTEPSPGALRALRERAIGRFTTGDVVDAAAAAGNPQAIEEQRRRAQERERVGQVTETQMRGLGG